MWNDNKIKDLINAVKDFKILFDPSHRYYRGHIEEKEKCWKTIANRLKETSSDVKNRWTYLRNQLAKQMREEAKGDEMVWPFSAEMAYFRDYIKLYKTREKHAGQTSEPEEDTPEVMEVCPEIITVLVHNRPIPLGEKTQMDLTKRFLKNGPNIVDIDHANNLQPVNAQAANIKLTNFQGQVANSQGHINNSSSQAPWRQQVDASRSNFTGPHRPTAATSSRWEANQRSTSISPPNLWLADTQEQHCLGSQQLAKRTSGNTFSSGPIAGGQGHVDSSQAPWRQQVGAWERKIDAPSSNFTRSQRLVASRSEANVRADQCPTSTASPDLWLADTQDRYGLGSQQLEERKSGNTFSSGSIAGGQGLVGRSQAPWRQQAGAWERKIDAPSSNFTRSQRLVASRNEANVRADQRPTSTASPDLWLEDTQDRYGLGSQQLEERKSGNTFSSGSIAGGQGLVGRSQAPWRQQASAEEREIDAPISNFTRSHGLIASRSEENVRADQCSNSAASSDLWLADTQDRHGLGSQQPAERKSGNTSPLGSIADGEGHVDTSQAPWSQQTGAVERKMDAPSSNFTESHHPIAANSGREADVTKGADQPFTSSSSQKFSLADTYNQERHGLGSHQLAEKSSKKLISPGPSLCRISSTDTESDLDSPQDALHFFMMTCARRIRQLPLEVQAQLQMKISALIGEEDFCIF